MAKPIVAIVGRPNVGKSTLFNRLTGRAQAIVKNIHGVTRDRNYRDISWDDTSLTLVDTGGFFPDDEDTMFTLIRDQALYVIEEADIILHVLDGKEGLNPLDIELANIIRSSGKKTLWVVNKIDTPNKENRVMEFYKIGTDELAPISAESGYGLDDLMEKVVSIIPEREHAPEQEYPNIAIVGRPNVGKSTIINTLLGKERMIVSPTAGTTRDAIDSICTYYRRNYLFIDTAGIRKKPKVVESLEEMAVTKAIKSIGRADVVIAVLDATQGIVEQDQKIIGLAAKESKGLLILFNKWDLITEHEKTYASLMREAQAKLWYAHFAPILTTSALLKKRLFKIFPILDEIISERNKRIQTAELNEFKKAVEDILPTYRGRKIKLFYLTQVSVRPPSFALFVNYPKGIKKHMLTMIEKKMRERYAFTGTPIRLFIRGRRS